MGIITVLKYNEDPLINALEEGFRQITPVAVPDGMVLEPAAGGFAAPILAINNMESAVFVATNDPQGGTFPLWRTRVTFKRTAGAVGSWEDIRNKYFNGVSYTTLYANVSVPDHISKVNTKNLNGTAASYELKTRFNYLSEEYDRFTSRLNEEEIVPSWSDQVVISDEFVGRPPQGYLMDLNPNQLRLPYVYPEAPFRNPISHFPYYNQVKISNKVSNRFSNLLKEMKMSDNFLSGYYHNLGSQKMSLMYQDGNTTQQVEQNILSIFPWLELDPSIQDPSGVMWNIDPAEHEVGAMPQQLRRDTFKLYLENLCLTHGKKWLDIMNNKDAYHEEYAYEINKFRDNPLGDPIQTFLVRPRDNITTFNDTQVQYGRTYIYRGVGHYLIMAQTYNYTMDPNYPTGGKYFQVFVNVEQKPMLIPINLFQRGTITIQPPPLPPNISFETSKNSTKEVNIYFSPMKGWAYQDFKMVTSDDQVQLDQMMQNRPASEIDLGFLFQTFSEQGNYEIFKMPTKPESLSDFSEYRLTNINNPSGDEDAIFVDSVVPNTKYYYLFRKINVHGLVSNPTAIYEVELLMDADDSRVVVNNCELPVPKTSDKTRKFKSLFQIEPALEHVVFNQQQEGMFERDTYRNSLDHVTLGMAEKSIWTRKFKFRIKSTTSGKIIDYNVKFKLTKDKTEEDF
tara:strand:+ start:891 stop:2927 length:2037 start_codon:yes stop_codon:yes gene_type:complete